MEEHNNFKTKIYIVNEMAEKSVKKEYLDYLNLHSSTTELDSTQIYSSVVLLYLNERITDKTQKSHIIQHVR